MCLLNTEDATDAQQLSGSDLRVYVQKKKVSGEPGEKNLRFEALLQGNFAAERLEFPLAAEKEREGHILTFWVEDCF